MARLALRSAMAVSAIVLGACSRHRAPVLAPATSTTGTPRSADVVATAGPCVDPRSDARRRFGRDADAEGLRVEDGADLDDDGVHDPFITHRSFCGTGGCTWEIYVSRGSCAVHVGTLFGMFPTPLAEIDNGLHALALTVRNGCAGMARVELLLRYEDGAYVPFSRRDCTCPETDAPDGGEVEGFDPDAACGDWQPATAKDLTSLR